jgi:nucleotide-binding universal stress UspA family protein
MAMGFTRILCPVDFSDQARVAVRTAAALVGAAGTLTLFHAVQLPSYVFFQGMLGLPSTPRDLEAEVDRKLGEWRAFALDAGAGRVEAKHAMGAAWLEIVNFAKMGAFDLIVVGTHGRKGIGHAILGSVAEKVVRHATCPVLVAREHE